MKCFIYLRQEQWRKFDKNIGEPKTRNANLVINPQKMGEDWEVNKYKLVILILNAPLPSKKNG